MSDLTKMKVAEARDALRAGNVTSVELTEACLGAIEGAGALNAYVHKTPEIALEQAKAADDRIKAGDAPAMCGIPMGIKDLFCTQGVESQAAAAILSGAQMGTSITAQVVVQSSVEGHLRGRVMSLWGVTNRSGPALGALLLGWIAVHLGFQIPILLAAALTAPVTCTSEKFLNRTCAEAAPGANSTKFTPNCRSPRASPSARRARPATIFLNSLG